MTFETRARGAVLDIHRAVEVMEMTTSTKEPRKIERFDQYRDKKQRNRRIGSLDAKVLKSPGRICPALCSSRH